MAENGAFVKDRKEVIFTADMPRETVDSVIDLCREYPEIFNVLCGLSSAYCERGAVSQEFFELTNIYYHRLEWTDDLKKVRDQILKFAPTVPEEISPKQCAAFGDGGNDIEMLNYCGYSYGMENASQDVKKEAKCICPSNEEDGVLVTLEKLFA